MNEIKASINRNGFPRKSLSKYLTDTIDFNEHDINIFHKWQVEKICGRRHRATLQNYKVTWTSLLINEKAKSSFKRRLLCPNLPPTWALLLNLPEHLTSPPDFSWVHVTRSSGLCVCFVDRCLSFCTFSFCHCVVCSSSTYGFWLPLRYLQILLISPIIVFNLIIIE